MAKPKYEWVVGSWAHGNLVRTIIKDDGTAWQCKRFAEAVAFRLNRAAKFMKTGVTYCAFRRKVWADEGPDAHVTQYRNHITPGR